MTQALSIRVINFLGDTDDLMNVHLIGPYYRREAAQADIDRLHQRLTNVDANYWITDFLSPRMITPDKVALIHDAESLGEILFENCY